MGDAARSQPVRSAEPYSVRRDRYLGFPGGVKVAAFRVVTA
jgi:hypothetical protein